MAHRINTSSFQYITSAENLAALKSKEFLPLLSSPENLQLFNSRSLHRIIAGLVDQQDVDTLDVIIQSLPADPPPTGPLLDGSAIARVLSLQVNSGSVARSLRAFHALQGDRRASNYSELLRLLAQNLHFELIHKIFDEYMPMDKITPTENNFTTIFAKIPLPTQPEEAEKVSSEVKKLLDKMVPLGAVPGVYTLCAVLKFCAALPNESLAQEAWKLVESNSPDKKITAAVCYEQMFAVFNQTKNASAAENVYLTMQLNGVKMTEYMSLQLLRNYCRFGDQVKAQGILNDMAKAELKPNLLHFNLMISMYGRYLDVDGAYKLIEVMKEEYNLRPNLTTYKVLLHMYRDKKDIESVERIIQEAEIKIPLEQQVQLKQEYLLALLMCRAPSRKIEKALAFVQQVNETKLDQATNNALLVYYVVEQSDLVRALRVVKEMKAADPPQKLSNAAGHALWNFVLKLNKEDLIKKIRLLLKKDRVYLITMHVKLLVKFLDEKRLTEFDWLVSEESHFQMFEAVTELMETRKKMN